MTSEKCGPSCAHESHAVTAPDEVDRLQAKLEQVQRIRATGEDFIRSLREALTIEVARADKAEADAAALRSELDGLLEQADDGKLHAPGCIGRHGYECKPWCESARSALSSDAGKKLLEQVETLTKERDALAKFKAYVHDRLDKAGVPTHPDGPHSANGCRIGDRLDLVLGEPQVEPWDWEQDYVCGQCVGGHREPCLDPVDCECRKCVRAKLSQLRKEQDELPAQFVAWVDAWLRSNEKKPEELRHGRFPLGMVNGWVERAESAEKERDEARGALLGAVQQERERCIETIEDERKTYGYAPDATSALGNVVAILKCRSRSAPTEQAKPVAERAYLPDGTELPAPGVAQTRLIAIPPMGATDFACDNCGGGGILHRASDDGSRMLIAEPCPRCARATVPARPEDNYSKNLRLHARVFYGRQFKPEVCDNCGGTGRVPCCSYHDAYTQECPRCSGGAK